MARCGCRGIAVALLLFVLFPLYTHSYAGNVASVEEKWSKQFGGLVISVSESRGLIVASISSLSVCKGSGKLLVVSPSRGVVWGLGLVGGSGGVDASRGLVGVAAGPRVYAVSLEEKRIAWSATLERGEAFDVDWTPNGSLLAVAAGPMLYVYNRFGELVAEKALEANAVSIDWSPDGRLVALGSSDGRVLVFNESLELVWESKSLGSPVAIVSWSPSGRLLAAGSLRPARMLAVYNRSGGVVWSTRVGEVTGAAWLNSSVLAVSLYDKGVLEFYNESGGLVERYRLGFKPTALYYEPLRGVIVVGGFERLLLVEKSLRESTSIHLASTPPIASYNSVAGLIAVGWNNTVSVYSVDGRLVWSSKLPGKITSVSWSPSGELLGVAGQDYIAVYTSSGEKKAVIEVAGRPSAIALGSKGLAVYTPSGKQGLLVYYSLDGEEEWSVRVPPSPRIVFHQGLFIVGGSLTPIIMAVDESGRVVWRKNLEASSVRSIAASTNGTIAVGVVKIERGETRGGIVLLDEKSGAVKGFTGWEKAVPLSLSWSPRGVLAASMYSRVEGRITREVGWLEFFKASGDKIGETGFFNCPLEIIAWVNDTSVIGLSGFSGLALYSVSIQERAEASTTPTAPATTSVTTTTTSTIATTKTTSQAQVTATTKTVVVTSAVYTYRVKPYLPLLGAILPIAAAILVATLLVVVALLVRGRR